MLRQLPLLILPMILACSAAYAACVSPSGAEGQLRYDSTAKMMFFCNGTSWQKLGGGNVCCGHTSTNGAGWLDYSAQGIYINVDTSGCGFTSRPHYMTAIQGLSSHWNIAGTTSIYGASPTGFTIYIKNVAGVAANVTHAASYQWFVTWCALPSNVSGGVNKGTLY